jgi:hypothetical protein
MIKFADIDYRFRPESYWRFSGPLDAILSNVKGTERRLIIRACCEAGRIEDVPDEVLQESLSLEDRVQWGRLHPSFMGGEYLPNLEPSQVEIARIELKSTMADAISVRARKDGAAVCYSVVDEYDAEFRVAPQRTLKPLTLWQLIRLIDGAVDDDSNGIPIVEWNRESGEDFAQVVSPFYPDISRHYKLLTATARVLP